jgi:hypothetical protein
MPKAKLGDKQAFLNYGLQERQTFFPHCIAESAMPFRGDAMRIPVNGPDHRDFSQKLAELLYSEHAHLRNNFTWRLRKKQYCALCCDARLGKLHTV